jgi:hypothetical protein
VDELVDMLEGPTSSVIVLAANGRVKRWSEQARTWIAQYCRTPFPTEADRLPDCFADWYRRQLALVAQETLLPSPRDPLVVTRTAGSSPCSLFPITSATSTCFSSTKSAVTHRGVRSANTG